VILPAPPSAADPLDLLGARRLFPADLKV
jgi:hypothetical protein